MTPNEAGGAVLAGIYGGAGLRIADGEEEVAAGAGQGEAGEP